MLKLTGKTLKGKNLIRRWGSMWEILVEKDEVLCFNEAGMLIQATDGGRDNNNREESRRWIRRSDPRDFSVEVIDD